MAIANGSPYYMAPALLQELENELSPLMLFFANPEDIVITEKQPTCFFLEKLNNCGIPIPAFSSPQRFTARAKKIPGPCYSPAPWGQSPAEACLYQRLLPGNSFRWTHEMRLLYERKTSISFLKEFLMKNRTEIYPELAGLPVIARSENELDLLLKKWKNIVIKAPLSSSGRGIRMAGPGKADTRLIRWIKSTLKQQDYFIVERRYEKKADLSFQFRIDETHKTHYLGTSFFMASPEGRYEGHYLNPKPGMPGFYDMPEINDTGKKLGEELELSGIFNNYSGFAGIDAMIYEENNRKKIHPCIEINPRYNMGLLSMFAEKLIHPESKGCFMTYYHPAYSYHKFAGEQTKLFPLIISDNRIFKGFLSLTDPSGNSRFGAYLLLR